MLHVVAGLILMQLFLPNGKVHQAFLRGRLMGSYIVLIGAIIWIVLAKPQIDSNQIAAHLFEPGGLGRWVHQSFGENQNAYAMIEHELAPVPAGKADHHRCKCREEARPCGQDRLGVDETQPPIGPRRWQRASSPPRHGTSLLPEGRDYRGPATIPRYRRCWRRRRSKKPCPSTKGRRAPRRRPPDHQ